MKRAGSLLLKAVFPCTALVWVVSHALAQQPVPDPEVPPEVAALDTAVENPDGDPEAEMEKKPAFDNSRTDINLYNKTVTNPGRVKSIFYTQTEIKDVHLAVNTYLKNIGRGGDLTFDEEALINRLGGLKNASRSVEGTSRFFTYPQFFLDSVVYYAPDDWVVWINGGKITQDTPRDSSNIRIKAITPEYVQVEWFPLEMDRVMEIWKAFPNKQVEVDAVHRVVSFTLKPNQTFSSYTMTSLEGKVLPVTVDVTKSVVPFNFEAPAEPVPDAITEDSNPTTQEE